MRSRSYKTEGIILKRVNVGEADRILTAFTKHRGKISCMAHGVRRPTSRKSASVELFNRTTLFLAKGKNLDILTQAETVESFHGIRNNLKATKAAYHVVELIDLLLALDQENLKVYQMLIEILRTIDTQQHATRRQIIDFEKNILDEIGFGYPKEVTQQALVQFIESIIERRLQSVKIFRKI